VRLAAQTSRPRDTVTSRAFTLDAPPTATVQPPPPALRALPQLCGRQPKLLLASGTTLLDACQTQRPELTKDALMNALIGTAPQDLAAAVQAGAITRAEATAALQAQRTQIIAMLMSSRPQIKVAASGK
jgi:hypothetical protein